MSTVAENRKVKADRVYKTLGKMSWQRIVLGIILIIYILFLSGMVSEWFFKSGNYTMADRCVLSEKWMDKNKPESKAIIDAGMLYFNGDTDGAYELITGINTENLYHLSAGNYTKFCRELAGSYTTSDPNRAQSLLSLADDVAQSFGLNAE